ncbi:hypothetical protein IIY68_00200 [Candidatus Saccharibacteria bacterium]|nr:hypothetical protein [Candidatus Saccharibacteria bacterium]
MKIKITKNGSTLNFIDPTTEKKFNYVEFADNLYNGEQIEIVNYGNISDDERKTIDQTVKDLNALAMPKKRKAIIAQLEVEQ